jgi:hypothetical protein
MGRHAAAATLCALLATGRVAAAQDTAPPPEPLRWSAEVRGGVLHDRSDTPAMLQRADRQPGNALVGWEDSTELAIRGAYEVHRGVEVDLQLAQAQFDVGADVFVLQGATAALVPAPIATGTLRLARAGAWVDQRILEPKARATSPTPALPRWRIAVGVLAGAERASAIEEDAKGGAALGLSAVTAGSEILAGLGIRGEVRLGRSPVTLSGEIALLWPVQGALLTLTTKPGSTYAGASIRHTPGELLLGIAYHF